MYLMHILSLAIALLMIPGIASAQEALEFIPGDDSEIGSAIRKQFVDGMTESLPDDSPATFKWLRTDVDGDAYDELFIKLEGDFCTDTGCAVVGFRKTEKGNWSAILTAVADSIETLEGGLTTVSGKDRTELHYDSGTGTLVPVKDRTPEQAPSPTGALHPKP